MERISTDLLRFVATLATRNSGVLAVLVEPQLLLQAALTIEEMDKDIAVYEHQIQEMQRQYGLMQREERDE